MTTMSTSKKVAIILAAVAGIWVATALKEEFFPSKPDRPVLKFLAKVAKFGMWFLFVAEPQPEQPQEFRAVDANHISHARSL